MPETTGPGTTGPGTTGPGTTGPGTTGPGTTGPEPRRYRSRVAADVAAFHRGFGVPLRAVPTLEVGTEQAQLRQALIDEEVGELRQAVADGDLVEIADALADIVYVAYGTAHVYGIELDAVLAEVHASNMTKLGADGRPVRRPDGKVLKGPGYRPPDVAAVLTAGPAGYPGGQ